VYFLASPVAWFVQLETMFVLVPPSRRTEHIDALRWVSLLALMVAAVGALGGWFDLVRARRAIATGDRRAQGNLWLARAALGLGLFFCIVIASMALPTWFLSPED
jgi:hypothetical protein